LKKTDVLPQAKKQRGWIGGGGGGATPSEERERTIPFRPPEKKCWEGWVLTRKEVRAKLGVQGAKHTDLKRKRLHY